MSRNAFARIERETNEAEDQRATNRREIAEARDFTATLHGEQAAHLERVMTSATHRCCSWSPVVPSALAFEKPETAGVRLLTRLISALRRAPIAFNIRSLEIQLQSQNTVMQSTTDTDLLIEIAAARRETIKELDAARQKYSALLPVGVVKVWGRA